MINSDRLNIYLKFINFIMKRKKKNENYYSNQNYKSQYNSYNINYYDDYYYNHRNESYNYGNQYYTDYSIDRINEVFKKFESDLQVNVESESNLENRIENVKSHENNEAISEDINSVKNCSMNIGQQTKDITKELIDQSYECIVCSEEIKFNSEIWSCKTCFTITHIKCIKDWIKKLNTNNEGDIFKFTCPHCLCVHKIKKDNLPVYNCFCEKYNSPDYKQTSNIYIPHSCGKSCDFKVCDHIKCDLPCHPGPHLQCYENVIVECFCGKESKSVACNLLKNSIINQMNIVIVKNVPKFICKSTCGKSLLCGNHSCRVNCQI